ncbi:MAG: hypothetical protein WCF57_24055 [Pyrinomonadaceae bacterium]
MSELDEEWARQVAEAENRARAAGRGDIADYLRLRASNDLARKAGSDWLFATFTDFAGEANRTGASIQLTRTDAHQFRMGNTTMVGLLLTFRQGVRALMIEAGWPRKPADGFIRGGGLAGGRVRHFGNAAADEELLLIRSESDAAPQWFVLERNGTRSKFLEERARRHVDRFTGVR